MQTINSISQSFIKEALPNEVCPAYLKFRYIEKIEVEDDDETKSVMFRGRYFEWHLLGATRGGDEPVFVPNKIGKKQPDGSMDYRPKAQIDLDIFVVKAKAVLKEMGLDVKKGKKQVFLKSDDMNGTLDWITNCLIQPEREAIYDVKYTETAYDDRWNGWANFEDKWEAKLQATQYILLYWMKYEKFVPFYFAIFGKSGWCRIIKIELTKDGVEAHERTVAIIHDKIDKWTENGWKAVPDFVTCMKCGYADICKEKATKPEIEVYQI